MGKEFERDDLCYGFKEIRYYEAEDELEEYLEFLRKMLPDLGIIFNTRKHKDTVKSQMNKKWGEFSEYNEKEFLSELRFFFKKRKAIKGMNENENRMREYYEKNREHSFWIDYENVCNNDSKVEEMYEFIGAPYDKKRIDEILKIKHSY